jgi:hypothetical protein
LPPKKKRKENKTRYATIENYKTSNVRLIPCAESNVGSRLKYFSSGINSFRG